MVIKQILNNNIVSCTDEFHHEVILMGKGLGWKRKAGDPISVSKAEKIFRMDTDAETKKLRQIFIEADENTIRTSIEIVDYANQILDKKLNKNIYITLTDHIAFAVERAKQGVIFQNPLHWELRKYYEKEYHVGLHALETIDSYMGERLPESEAGSIALHFVNSEYDFGIERTAEITKFAQSALDIIRYGYGNLDFSMDSLNYQRFVTHLLFFAERVIDNKMLDDSGLGLKETLQLKYPKEYEHALKLRKLAEKQYDRQITDEEVVFLCIHIIRVTQREEKNDI